MSLPDIVWRTSRRQCASLVTSPFRCSKRKGAVMKRVQFECLAAAGCLPAASWRADGTFFNANAALRTLLGYKGNDINAGKIHWREITPPEYKPLDDQALDEI